MLGALVRRWNDDEKRSGLIVDASDPIMPHVLFRAEDGPIPVAIFELVIVRSQGASSDSDVQGSPDLG